MQQCGGEQQDPTDEEGAEEWRPWVVPYITARSDAWTGCFSCCVSQWQQRSGGRNVPQVLEHKGQSYSPQREPVRLSPVYQTTPKGPLSGGSSRALRSPEQEWVLLPAPSLRLAAKWVFLTEKWSQKLIWRDMGTEQENFLSAPSLRFPALHV